MAEPISIQQLKDASLDVKSLEEVVNGDENVVVTTRLGETYPSVKGSIKKVFEIGGLPAKPFETKALMEASELTDGDYAYVTNDATNNGLYVKTAGVWVKSDYDPLGQSKEYTDSEVSLSNSRTEALANSISQKIGTDTTEVAVNIVDALGNALVTIKSDATVDIVGLDYDIAKSINDSNASIESTKNELSITFERDSSSNALNIIDSAGNVLAKIDDEARLHLVGLDTDVVSAINSKSSAGIETINTSNLANYSYKDTFDTKSQSLLNFSHYQNVGLVAPVPLGQLKQNFTLNDNWLDSAVLSEMPDFIPVTTPYGINKGVVHPHIVEIPNGFAGYRYIVCITGYTNGNTREENPFILASNDLLSFDLVSEVLDTPESFDWEKGILYNSDPVGFYDPKTLEFCLCWRRFYADTSGIPPNTSNEVLYVKRTKDLVTWSDAEVICTEPNSVANGQLLSPAILYNVEADEYWMYTATGTRSNDSIRLHKSKHMNDDWELVGNISAMPVGAQAWHLDARYIGDKIVICVHERGNDSVGLGSRIGISSDGVNFTWASGYWDDVPERYENYKSTFLPEFNDQNQMRMVYIWTSNNKYVSTNMSYKLFVAKTPFFDAGVVIK